MPSDARERRVSVSKPFAYCSQLFSPRRTFVKITTTQILGIKALDRAKKVLKSARPLRIIHRVKVRVGGIVQLVGN